MKKIFISIFFATLLLSLKSQTVTLYLTTSGGSFPTEKWSSISTGINGTGTVVWAQGNGAIGNNAGALTDEAISLNCGTTYFLNSYDQWGDSWDGTTYELRDALGGGGNLIINNSGNSPDGFGGFNASTWIASEDLETSESFIIPCPCSGTAPTGTIGVANVDCSGGTFDITITSINNGTATSTDIYVNGVLDIAGSQLSNVSTANTYTITLKPVGGATTCETNYTISAPCITPCSGNATVITDGYTQFNITTPGNGGADDWVGEAESCGTADAGEFEDSDVKLFSYTTGATAGENFYFTIEYDYNTDESHSIGVYENCIADSLTNCITSYYNFDDIAGVCVQGLSANTTYYIAVTNDYFNIEALNFDVVDFTVETSSTIPDDECATSPVISLSDPYDGSTRCSYTASAGSPDTYPNSCGSIENDSWIQFIADSTTAVIDYDVSNCKNGNGVQLSAFSGSCGNLSMLSGSCLNHAGNNSSGTWTFTGLTIGDTYYIRADGYAGDRCNYSYTPIAGVLPVKLTSFSGKALNNGYNQIIWSTSSEINNDYFELEKSDNGYNFTLLNRQSGAGNSNTTISYLDYDSPTQTITYYRLKQVDYNGNHSYSKTIAVTNNNNPKLKLYPNPSNTGLFYIDNLNFNDIKNIMVFNNLGKTVLSINHFEERLSSIDLSHQKEGIYYIKITYRNEVITKKVVIKK